jgi:hypothetical protein
LPTPKLLPISLGWTAGVPGAAVIVRQGEIGSQVLVDSQQTDSAGRMTLGPLAPGQYTVTARRVLTDAERAKRSAGSSL